jgi:endonuclease-3
MRLTRRLGRPTIALALKATAKSQKTAPGPRDAHERGSPAAPPTPDTASLSRAAQLLLERYGAYPDESAGPVLDQLVWFLLSTRTTVENCEAAYASLRQAFPDWAAVAEAEPEYLGELLRPAGLFRSRAKNLLATLELVKSRFGSPSLEELRSWGDTDCEAFLLSLPGVGLKVARCVLAFGLGRDAFAVDAHIWRVARRLGWHSFPGEAPSQVGVDAIQGLVRGVRDLLSFHVNLIRLGREFCPAVEPRCAACPLAALCQTGSGAS